MNMEYTTIDLEGALRRAFVNHKADFILIEWNSRANYLNASLELGLNNCWLELDEDNSGMHQRLAYKLTEDGKKYFGLSK